MEAFLEGEWESLSKMFSCEDSDLLLLLHSNVEREIPFNFSHANENGANFLVPSNSNLDPNTFHSSSQESNHSHSHSSNEMESTHFTFFDHENCPNGGEFTHTFDDQAMEFPTIDNKMVNMIHDDLVGEILQLKAQMLCNDHMENGPKEIDDSCKEMQLKGSKKRPNASRERRNKKAKKASENDEEMNNIVQSSSTSTSEEETGNASESTGKAKSSKSPATDPQSLYARKRRQKINERLRILQNLVPNGTKVDISTMLEEAVHYVKFLQLQIKLLSSDKTWMYAPIAYNGMDIGFYQKIVPSL